MTTNFVTLLIDRSGSMSLLHEYILPAINNILDVCRKYDTNLSIIETDSIDQFNMIVENKPINQIQNLDEFTPRGLTPLFDVLVQTIRYTSNQNAYNKILVILSDGFNNKSKSSSAKDIQNLASQLNVNLLTTIDDLSIGETNPIISIHSKVSIYDHIEKCKNKLNVIHLELDKLLIGEKNENIQSVPAGTTWRTKKKRNTSQFGAFLG